MTTGGGARTRHHGGARISCHSHDDLIDFEGVACAGDLRAADTLKGQRK